MTNYINNGYIIKNNDVDEVINIPYNLNNILITEDNLIDLFNTYNVKIDKIYKMHYFIEAFTHKSYCKKDIIPEYVLIASKKELGNPENLVELQNVNYEILEFLGDRVLKLIVSYYLKERYPKQDQGFLTRLQTKIEDKNNLALMSKEIGLSKYFIISKQIEQINGRNLQKIHEDIFESFIAALFLSNGFEQCLLFITNLLETLIDYSEKLYCDNNYKDQLLRIHHQNKWSFPQYITIHVEGPPHKRKYIMGVEKHNDDNKDKQNINKFNFNDKIKYFKNKCISYGIGSSKKEGEQSAAKMALIILGILNEDQYTQTDIYYPPWDKLEKLEIYNTDNCDIILKSDSDSIEEYSNDNILNI
jgi:ribonuclease-3